MNTAPKENFAPGRFLKTLEDFYQLLSEMNEHEIELALRSYDPFMLHFLFNELAVPKEKSRVSELIIERMKAIK